MHQPRYSASVRLLITSTLLRTAILVLSSLRSWVETAAGLLSWQGLRGSYSYLTSKCWVHTRNSGGADFIFIPERPPKADPWEDELCSEIKKVSVLVVVGLFFTPDISTSTAQ